jgi:hypothetical protein
LFSTAYTVIRRYGKWVNGRFELDEPLTLNYIGPVQPATNKELDQLPEGDRYAGTMKFFCKPPATLYVTAESSSFESGEAYVSDEIIYRGARYKIFAVKDWTPNGYIRAFAYRVGGV